MLLCSYQCRLHFGLMRTYHIPQPQLDPPTVSPFAFWRWRARLHLQISRESTYELTSSTRQQTPGTRVEVRIGNIKRQLWKTNLERGKLGGIPMTRRFRRRLALLLIASAVNAPRLDICGDTGIPLVREGRYHMERKVAKSKPSTKRAKCMCPRCHI